MSGAARGGPVRAVLFDLDGVLVDSYEAWLRVVAGAAREFGAPPVDEARFRSVWGQGISADVVSLYPGRTHEEVEAAYVRGMARHGDRVAVNPEAAGLLRDLRREGVALAVVTNTQEGLAREILSATGLLGLFDAVASMRPGVREKPHPDLVLRALSDLGVRASEALMVGDSAYDRDAAAAAAVPFLPYDLRGGASLARAVRARLHSPPRPGA